MYCRNCGRELNNKWKICPYCNTAIHETKKTYTEQQFIFEKVSEKTGANGTSKKAYKKRRKKRDRKDNNLIIVISAVIAIALVLIGIVFFAGNGKRDNTLGEWIDFNENPEMYSTWKNNGYRNPVIINFTVHYPLGNTEYNNYYVLMGVAGLDMAVIMQENEEPVNTWNWLMKPAEENKEGKVHYIGKFRYLGETDAGQEEKVPIFIIDDPQETYREWDEGADTTEPAKKGETIRQEMDGEYILPNSSVQSLSNAEIDVLSEYERQMAINEIYARHGRRFNDTSIQAYFDSKSWYVGTTEPENFNDSVFSQVELNNINALASWEGTYSDIVFAGSNGTYIAGTDSASGTIEIEKTDPETIFFSISVNGLGLISGEARIVDDYMAVYDKYDFFSFTFVWSDSGTVTICRDGESTGDGLIDDCTNDVRYWWVHE